MFRIPFIAIFIFGILSFGYSQDTVKKTKRAIKTTIPIKPTTPYTNHKYPYAYRHLKSDSTDTAKVVITDKTLKGQYQYLLTKVYHYQQPLISALWKSASDTLNVNRAKLKETQAKLNVATKTIDSLTNGITTKDQTLNQSNARRNEIGIFGLYFTKTTYNLIVWGLILALVITAVVVIARTGSFSKEAKYRTQLYSELEEEFKNYKTKANDKEKKLARELQTERNKLDDLDNKK
jgi:hypothetical protein